jgi:hypothetical protein
MNESNNPYAPPQANVTPAFSQQDLELLSEPRALSAGAGLNWLSEAWPLVKKDLGIWVLITLALMVIQLILAFIPFVGAIAGNVLTPVFTGGLLMGIRAASAGQPLRFDTLFEGFKHQFAPLAGLGALMLLVMFLLGVVGSGVFYATMPAMNSMQADPSAALSGSNLGIVGIVVGLLSILVGMLFFFATPLVALNEVPVFKALGMSFKASLRNILPILVYGILVVLLAFLGAIPLLLGLLVVIPLIYVSSYAAYRQVFLK